MNWLNYHHLYYFWVVAKVGSITKATKKLKLAQPTISAQIHQLEESMGTKLFTKKGRGLSLTEKGKLVFQYAQEIFSTGQDLMYAIENPNWDRPTRLNIGIQMVIPKLLAYEFMKVALSLEKKVIPVCTEDNLTTLLSRLSVSELDLILSDCPVPPSLGVKAYSHLLGQSGISFCASKPVSKALEGEFPRSLNHQPFLMPTDGTALKIALSQWFEKREIKPEIIAECQDTALLKVFGQMGHGIFAIPTVIEGEVVKKYNIEVVGRTTEVQESFYAITDERNIRHPSIKAITDQVKIELFS